MKNLLFIVFSLVFAGTAWTQKKACPRSLQAAVQQMQMELTPEEKTLLTKTPDDSLRMVAYPDGQAFEQVFHWVYDERKGKHPQPSALHAYLEKQGITHNQLEIVLLAGKQALQGNPRDEAVLLAPFLVKEQEIAAMEKKRFVADSLYGVYIPKDLDDCISQIYRLTSDSVRAEIRTMTEDEFSARMHFGFGMWMRNSWRLWGGSRLSRYFNEHCVFHPDDMSGIILTSFHRHLMGQEIKLEEQIRYYHDYWKTLEGNQDAIAAVTRKKHLRKLPETYDFSDSLCTERRIHAFQRYSFSKEIWVYEFFYGWKKIPREDWLKLAGLPASGKAALVRGWFTREE